MFLLPRIVSLALTKPPTEKRLLNYFFRMFPFPYSLINVVAKLAKLNKNFLIQFKYCFLFSIVALDNATSWNKKNFIIFSLLKINRSSIFLILKDQSQKSLIFPGSPPSKLSWKFQHFRNLVYLLFQKWYSYIFVSLFFCLIKVKTLTFP